MDFYSDASTTVLREILSEFEVPDYVQKTACLIPSEEFRKDHRQFAWAEDRQFAIDTPADTWLSAHYFAKTAHLVPFQHRERIGGMIRRAAEAFGVELDELTKEAVSLDLPDEAFLVVVPLETVTEKSAALAACDDQTHVRIYPVYDAEHVGRSAQWYPRNLSGSLGYLRPKVAAGLLAACERFGVNPPETLTEDLRPIKRSSLLAHLRQRSSLLEVRQAQAARQQRMSKAAAVRGVETNDYPEVPQPDDRLILAYRELIKQAYGRKIPLDFFRQLAALDELSELDKQAGVVPVAMLDRQIEDDMPNMTCKLADRLVYLPELLDKVSKETWVDLTPAIADQLHDLSAVKEAVEKLDPLSQRILYTMVRGY